MEQVCLESSITAFVRVGLQPSFSRDLENLSPNLSPKSKEALNSPPNPCRVEGLGFALAFLDDLNCQACNPPLGEAALEVPRFGFPPSVFCLLNFPRWILN
ncbi:MAG: hypothetical protein V7K48_05245 [Nostoc sp.]|uniref:hypothetical protein n=1 Tax=Nostoc sp. TaxID=1180 RepID=UPI002FFB6EE3